jgi:hypothetical protein
MVERYNTQGKTNAVYGESEDDNPIRDWAKKEGVEVVCLTQQRNTSRRKNARQQHPNKIRMGPNASAAWAGV